MMQPFHPGGNAPRCQRCGAPLSGPFCGNCGCTAGYPVPPPYAMPAPAQRSADWGSTRHGAGRTVALVIVACVLAAMFVLVPIGAIVHSVLSPQTLYSQADGDTYGGDEGDYGGYGNYGDYFGGNGEAPYGYGDAYGGPALLQNVSDYMRLDVLSTTRASAEEQGHPGYLLLTVEVCLTNLSYEIVDYAQAGFEVMSGYGKLIGPQPGSGAGAFDSGRLLPEGQARGFLYFLVPEEEYGTLLCYTDEANGDMLLFPLM